MDLKAPQDSGQAQAASSHPDKRRRSPMAPPFDPLMKQIMAQIKKRKSQKAVAD